MFILILFRMHPFGLPTYRITSQYVAKLLDYTTSLNYNPNPLLKRVITDESMQNFKQKLSLINWDPLSENLDVNTVFDDFLNKFNHCYNLCFPIKRINGKSSKTDLPWITLAIRKSIKKKNSMYGKFLKEKNGNKITLFNKYKNYC